MLQNASVYYDVITPLYSTLVCLCRFLSPQTVSVDWKVLPLLNVDLVWMESGFGAHTHTHLSKCVPYIFLAYGINFLTSITRSFKMIFAVRYLEHCTLVRFRLDSIRFGFALSNKVSVAKYPRWQMQFCCFWYYFLLLVCVIGVVVFLSQSHSIITDQPCIRRDTSATHTLYVAVSTAKWRIFWWFSCISFDRNLEP